MTQKSVRTKQMNQIYVEMAEMPVALETLIIFIETEMFVANTAT